MLKKKWWRHHQICLHQKMKNQRLLRKPVHQYQREAYQRKMLLQLLRSLLKFNKLLIWNKNQSKIQLSMMTNQMSMFLLSCQTTKTQVSFPSMLKTKLCIRKFLYNLKRLQVNFQKLMLIFHLSNTLMIKRKKSWTQMKDSMRASSQRRRIQFLKWQNQPKSQQPKRRRQVNQKPR